MASHKQRSKTSQEFVNYASFRYHPGVLNLHLKNLASLRKQIAEMLFCNVPHLALELPGRVCFDLPHVDPVIVHSLTLQPLGCTELLLDWYKTRAFVSSGCCWRHSKMRVKLQSKSEVAWGWRSSLGENELREHGKRPHACRWLLTTGSHTVIQELRDAQGLGLFPSVTGPLEV